MKHCLRNSATLSLILTLIPLTSKSQVLISLIFGDKLNSPNLEFGLEGGLNPSTIRGIEEAEFLTNFNLGFYFNFRLKNSWFLYTGVRVKSNVGAKGLNVYSTGDADLDSVFVGGSVTRKINYFYVPAAIKYRFGDHFFILGGFQIGLMSSAKDIFLNTVNTTDDLTFTNTVTDEYNRIDSGLLGGIGYKLLKDTSMSFGVSYYYGLTNIYRDGTGATAAYNSTFYIYVDIPIGAGKAKTKAEENSGN